MIFFTLNFGKYFFAYGQRYSLKISTAKEIIDYADFEYTIFLHQKHFVWNGSGGNMVNDNSQNRIQQEVVYGSVQA